MATNHIDFVTGQTNKETNKQTNKQSVKFARQALEKQVLAEFAESFLFKRVAVVQGKRKAQQASLTLMRQGMVCFQKRDA